MIGEYITPYNIIMIGILGLLMVSLYGLLIVRNLIKIVMVLQMMVKAAVLALVLAGQVSSRASTGQSLAATVIVADTMVAVVALAIAIQIRRRFNSLDLIEISTLRG